jgi:hypothetical protein
MNWGVNIGVALIALLGAWAPPNAQLEQGFFSKNLYPIFEKANCRTCHSEDGIGSATRLQFPPDSASPDDIEAFGHRLVALVDRTNPEKSLLRNKPTNREKHTGGKVIAPGSEEERVLFTWVDYLARLDPAQAAAVSKQPDATPLQPKLHSMRRLTHSQYNKTVRDLLGDQTEPADHFPPEDFVHGFKNHAESQRIPPLLAEAYSVAAERLARNAFRGGDVNRLIPCRPSSANDSSCGAQFIRRFGLRAYRRPLTEKEFQRLADIFARETARTGEFLKGAQLVVETMLQSPNFLFRIERAAPGLEGYYMASRLSYFLWDSMPDDELFASAASGELLSAAGVEKAARRLLADPRARAGLEEFTSQWLRFDLVLNTVKDRRLYPQFTPELAVAMTEESKLLVHHLVWNDLNFMELFTAGYAFVNSELASLYGSPSPETEFGRVDFGSSSDRAGILGSGAFLAATSKPEDTSPTARGLFVREHFLCQRVPDPPPGTNSNLPPITESKPQTNRERLQVHMANPTCVSCHSLIDPIGVGLEKFDAIGKRREKQLLQFIPDAVLERRSEQRKTMELPLDTTSSVTGIPDSDFSSPKELGKVLSTSPACQECVVKQLFRYALGRQETPDDSTTIKQAWAAFRDSQFRFKELMIFLVKTPQFRLGGS